jgi:hypothetical protein
MRDISRRAIRRARVLPKSAFLGLGHQLDCGLWRCLGWEIGVCSGVDRASFRAGVNLLCLDGGVTITYPFFMLTFCKTQQNSNHVNMIDLFKLTSTEQSRATSSEDTRDDLIMIHCFPVHEYMMEKALHRLHI